jgi:hypothetical protein
VLIIVEAKMADILPVNEKSSNNNQLEKVAEELEKGNGCAAKLLLDSAPDLATHQEIFGAIQSKHAQMYPNSNQLYKSSMAEPLTSNDGLNGDSIYVPNRIDTTITTNDVQKVPGALWGTNVYSRVSNIVEGHWDLDNNDRQSTCLDLTKPENEGKNLTLIGFE